MKRTKGFTLVELLIVIVVIGVLAAMMLFSSTEATETAKATKIINNLQIIKKAALQYYADNSMYFMFKTDHVTIDGKEVYKYIDNANMNAKDFDEKEYFFKALIPGYGVAGPIMWYVFYHGNDMNRQGIRRRLEGRARSQQLYRFSGTNWAGGTYGTSGEDFGGQLAAENFFNANIYKAEGDGSDYVGLRIK